VKSAFLILLFLSITAFAAPAAAAVVITQRETVNAGSNGSNTTTRVITIDGNKQKSADDQQEMIIDLDKGTATIVNPAARTASEMAFPFTGPIAALLQGMYGANLTFRSTGAQKTAAGYQCNEYLGAGRLPTGDMTITGCFSTEAPGAAEYTAFYRKFAGKLNPSAADAVPGGIPLFLDTTVKLSAASIPGVPPEQAKTLSEMAAKQPPVVSSTQVIGVRNAEIPADTFLVPAGYTREKLDTSTQSESSSGVLPPSSPGPQ